MGLFFLFFLKNPLLGKTVVLVHTNDIHGVYRPYPLRINGEEREVGGMAALSDALARIRGQEKRVVYIDKGDLLTGTPAAEFEYRGVLGGVMIEFLNRLGCDLWCPGNHDFDLGQENTLGLVRLARFPAVLANIVYQETGDPFPVKPFVILDVDGLKIGLIGLMEESFAVEVQREKIRGLKVQPVVEVLRARMPELDRSSDVIVVLFHGRFHQAVGLAKSVPGIDVILVASEDGRFEIVNGALIQSTFGHLRTLGYLKLDVEGDRVSDHAEKQIWLWAKTPTKPSRDIQDLIEEVDEAIGQTYSEVIGEALHDHLAKGPEVESALGNWITDAMRWRTGADVGLQNTGGIRDDIHAGPISREDIFRVSPFRNTVVVFSLSGQQIKDLLEHDIEKGWDRLQVSGLKYTYRPRSVAPYGKRVMSVEVLGEKVVEGGKVLLPEKTYSVVSNNYLVGHAEDKYFGFAVKKFQDTGRLIHEVLMDWLRKHRLLDYREEGRIVAIRPPGSSRVPGG